MHKKLVNEAILEVSFRPDGPILIKAGDSGLDPSLPDMEFVRTRGQVFLPGSSLKGVIRSHSERIMRSLQAEVGEGKGACDPLSRKSACSERLESLDRKTNLSSKQKHQQSCFICRMFGNTVIASRILFSDAMPEAGHEIRLEERNGVAIDRVFGSVAHGPFNYEVVTEGSFKTHIVLKNFTLSQLTLLGLALRDIDQGRVPIGFAKSRGLGRVKVEWKSLEVRYPLAVIKGQSDTDMLQGVGSLAGETGYGFPANDKVAFKSKAKEKGIEVTTRKKEPEDKQELEKLEEKEGILIIEDDGWGTAKFRAKGSDAVQALFREAVSRWQEEVMSG